MKSWKRKLLFSLLFVVPMGLAACGSKDNVEEAPKDADGNTIMTVGQRVEPNPKLPEGDSYSDNAYRRLIKDRLNIAIESGFEAGGEDYDRQVSLAIASQELPDLMVVNRETLEELADNDLIADLSDVYEEFASDRLKEIYESYDNSQLEAGTIDGKLLGLPGTSNDFGPGLIWIRQDWLDKLNIELDEDGNNAITLEELKDTAKTFIDKDASGTGKTQGLAFTSGLNGGDNGAVYAANGIMNALGAYPKYYFENESGEVYYGSNTPETKKGLEYLNGLFEEGIIDSQFGTRTYDDINAMMVNGELGIIPGAWHVPDWGLVQAKTSNPDAEFTPFAIENSEGEVVAPTKSITPGFAVVRKDFEQPEAVVEMFNLIYDEVAYAENMEQDFPELYEYAKLSVDGSVKPFNLEVFNNLSEIDDAVQASSAALGKSNMDDISKFIVRSNAEKIKNYLDNPEEADPTDWAVYESRLLAVNNVMNGIRESGNFKEIQALNLNDFGTIKARERSGSQVSTLEEVTFIDFVTGKESLDNFDTYVENWNNQGGKAILDEVQTVIKK